MEARMGKKRQFSIGFSQQAHEWLAKEAAYKSVGKAEIIRRLVDERIEQHQKEQKDG